MTPAISVVMPVFNNAAYLPDAIESILNQSFADLELIVVDDGSSDASAEIAADYAKRDSRMRPIVRPRNPTLLSGAQAANAGIAAARGDYIARMDSDDIALPNRLAVELAHMKEHGLDICGGQALMFGEENKPMWYPQTGDGIRCELFFRSGMLNPTLLVRGDLMRQARYGEEDAFEEYEFQTRMFFLAKLGNSPELVHRFRWHGGNTTRVLEPQKARSRWQLRFKYFFRLYPQATLADFRAVHAVAWTLPFETIEELETAGRWLVLLSRVDEVKVRERMMRRWTESCAAAKVSGTRALQTEFAARILEPPG